MNPIKHRFLILSVAFLAIAAAVYFIPNLKADYNFENFFPKNAPELDFYQAFEEEFGSDEQVLMIAFQRQPSIFDTVFLQKIKQITLACRKSPFVENAQSLPTLSNAQKTPFGIIQKPILKTNRKNYANDSLNLVNDPRIADFILSKNAQTTAIILALNPRNTEIQNDSLIQFLEILPSKFGLRNFHFGGEIYTQTSYIRMLEEENFQLIPLFAIAVTLVLILLYRSFISILVPTLSVLVGLILLYGYAAFIGRNINLSTLMFPTIMMVVGMSDLIHFYTKYQQELRTGKSKKSAILHSIEAIRGTLFLTSLTTIIGFLSVALSPMPHVKTFGLDGAVGVGLAFVIAITFTPVLLSFLPAKKTDASRINWDKINLKIHQFNHQYPNQIIGFCLFLLTIAMFGIIKIDTNNYLLGSISDDAKLKKDYLFFENELAGVRSFEVAISVKDGRNFDDLTILKNLEKFENYLKNKEVIGPIFSPLTFYKTAYSIEKGRGLKYYQLPETEKDVKRLKKYLPLIPHENYLNDSLNFGRLHAKMRDIGRLQVRQIIDDTKVWITENIDPDLLDFHFTGRALLVDKTNSDMIQQMFISFLLAFGLISLIMAWLFRDSKMIVLSLIPNILPLVLTAGVMGFLDVELNGSTAIIFTIAFVIAVDDTIHFLSKFKKEMDKKRPLETAIKNTLLQAGKAIMITSIVLVSGYFILFFSDFKEAYYHGVLICFTLFWALLADLFLLPVLLQKWWRKE